MQTDALRLAEYAAKTGQPERLSWGVLEFEVIDLERTIEFWTQALGLHVREQDEQTVTLGTKEQTLFLFREGASVVVSPQHLGMYHVAIGVPDQEEFSRLMARLMALRVPASPVDHLMSKAIYIKDHDGLEIEIAFETPERFGRFGDVSDGALLFDVNGEPHSGRAALDLKAELQHAQGRDLEAPISEGAFLAHVHFKVDRLDTAVSWFEGIGFARNLMLPDFGLADMGAGAAYTHRIAMNIWSGPNLQPAPDTMARLTHYELRANDPAIIENAKGLQVVESGLTGLDPTGTLLSIKPAYSL